MFSKQIKNGKITQTVKYSLCTGCQGPTVQYNRTEKLPLHQISSKNKVVLQERIAQALAQSSLQNTRAGMQLPPFVFAMLVTHHIRFLHVKH